MSGGGYCYGCHTYRDRTEYLSAYECEHCIPHEADCECGDCPQPPPDKGAG